MSAQGRNRTADTGIFKPFRFAVFYEGFARFVGCGGRTLDPVSTGPRPAGTKIDFPRSLDSDDDVMVPLRRVVSS